MMSSAKARPEKAELERRVKRRPQRLHRKRWPPSTVVPSFVTTFELQRGHSIDALSSPSAYTPHSAAREPSNRVQENAKLVSRTVLTIHGPERGTSLRST